MRAFSQVFVYAVVMIVLAGIHSVTFSHRTFAATRAPATSTEYSLLYWRYLCRDHAQTETINSGRIELNCPSQGRTVRANARDGQVLEVVEYGSP